MTTPNDDEFMTVGQAGKDLNISRMTMSQLVSEKGWRGYHLDVYERPVDTRKRWVKRAEVVRLKRSLWEPRLVPKARPAA